MENEDCELGCLFERESLLQGKEKKKEARCWVLKRKKDWEVVVEEEKSFRFVAAD